MSHNKCQVCGQSVSGKARTCSPKCRKILSRASVTEPSVTSPNPPSVTKPPKPTYMRQDDCERWDGVECKHGPCLRPDCAYR